MADPSFGEVEACVFDAYGTLFDVHSAAARMKDELGDQADALSDMWRLKQLQYTWLRSLMGRHEDFWQVTGDALDYSMRALDIENDALRAKLMELYLQLEAYPEVVDVLTKLKDSGKKTAILSNGEPSMLIAAAKSAKIYPLLDGVLSIEKVGIFKPHPSTYQIAVDELKVAANHIRGELTGSRVYEPRFANTCWSLIGTNDGIKVGANYQAGAEKIDVTDKFISQGDEAADIRKATYEESLGWYEGITSDMFS